MAYATRWRIPFKDYNGTLREILIQQDGWTGTVTDVIGGDTPILIDEDDSENIFTHRVRGKTGRLVFIEETYGEFDDIYPVNSLDRRVILDGVFFGYIKPESSEFDWAMGKRQITLNIQSPLAMGSKLLIPARNPMTTVVRAGYVFADMMYYVGYSSVVIPMGEGSGTTLETFFQKYVDTQLVYPFSTYNDYHYSADEFISPVSVAELLNLFCQLYGWIARDAMDGSNPMLLITMPDYSGTYYKWGVGTISSNMYHYAELLNKTGASISSVYDFAVIADDNPSEKLILPFSRIDMYLDGDVEKTIDPPYNASNAVGRVLTPHGDWFVGVSGCVVESTEDHDNVITVENVSVEVGEQIFRLRHPVYPDYQYEVEHKINMKLLHSSTLRWNIPLLIRTDLYYYHKDLLRWQPVSGVLESDMIFLYNFTEIQGTATLVDIEVSIPGPPSNALYIDVAMYKKSVNPSENNDTQFDYPRDNDTIHFEYIKLQIPDVFESVYNKLANFYKRLEGVNGGEQTEYHVMNNHRFYRSSPISPHEPTYFLQSQRRLQVKMRTDRDISIFDYICLNTVDTTGKKWRLIASKTDVRKNETILTMHYSSSFQSD